MRKEFGKWLMDIAKYIITAVVLSSVFGEIESWVLYVIGIVSVAITLLIGLYLVSDKPIRSRGNSRHSNSQNWHIMGFIIMCGFVTLIALAGGGYFYIQDRKVSKRQESRVKGADRPWYISYGCNDYVWLDYSHRSCWDRLFLPPGPQGREAPGRFAQRWSALKICTGRGNHVILRRQHV